MSNITITNIYLQLGSPHLLWDPGNRQTRTVYGAYKNLTPTGAGKGPAKESW